MQAAVPHRSLTEWLDHVQRQHPAGIALGLDRVHEVATRLGLTRPARRVITVAGTNGKGSTVAFVEAIARAAKVRVGAYTSPHLLRYNERVRIDGVDASDADLVAGFEAVEAARGTVALTYFEFGTLAALWQFERADLDLAVLEVGLGGRLDAVNLVSADAMIITTVALDHQDWLGADRESIGFEKAGVMRAGRPVVLAEADPPASVLRHAYALGAVAIRAGCDYFVERDATGWRWREPGFSLTLPCPTLSAPAQLDNAAAAIAALRASGLRLPRGAFRTGIAAARLPGRLQTLTVRVEGGLAEVVLDVGHNPQAAEQLALWLSAHPAKGRELAVFSALADKDIPALIAPLIGRFSHWWLAGLAEVSPRGLDAEALASRMSGVGPATRCVDVDAALADALGGLRPGDRLLVFGSFFTVAGALAFMERQRQPL